MPARRPPARRLLERSILSALKGTTRVLRALPTRWVLTLGDRLGDLLFYVDRRGRRVGRENLRVVFGEGLSRVEKRRLLRVSMQGTIRSVLITLHASPLTGGRVRRWLVVPREVEQTLRDAARQERGAVVVSAHLGNWEILNGLSSVFHDVGDTTVLAEPIRFPALDEFLVWLRGSGGGRTASRRGGAMALAHHVRRGGIAALLIDRNTRRNQGGLWAPFFGLDACTTPLPGYLARRHDVPIAPLFCIPLPDGRSRLELGPEVSREVRSDDADADILEITRRMNALVEAAIRAHPEAWNWTLKRFKSRPTRERGAYPAYSLYDPG